MPRGFAWRALPTGFDLDTVGDLAWLAAARKRGDSLPCPRTLAYLDEAGLWRFVPEAR